MVEQDCAGRRAPPRGAVLSATGWTTCPAEHRAWRTVGRKPEASGRENMRQVPSIGPLRAALLLALMQTPHRFRSKRQLWTYSGLGVETHDSAQHRYVDGQLQRSKKPQQIRGLNQNHNHEMKKIFT